MSESSRSVLSSFAKGCHGKTSIFLPTGITISVTAMSPKWRKKVLEGDPARFIQKCSQDEVRLCVGDYKNYVELCGYF